MTARLDRGGNQPKGRGRNVARNAEVARLGNLITKNAYALFILIGAYEKIVEHQLSMIAGRNRFAHGGFPLGKKAGKKERAFELCARNRRRVVDSPQRRSLDQ